ncbi:hypothetical protein CCM_08149 [Cordyceps militaris CM01]|uniref:BTB domain-containing protein n=1 Tax=Cordyceps militaris (strain CM01) TaxID=983644 RepID=G3JNQ6_CORMM|nr:uncharacterized protein CCM_08149 [Cordyceps militaris CM01]EGX89896.1 hypothetical protein CCM_08149 [Cordyceps militaris CM01]
MQPETVLQAAYLPGKKPPPAAAAAGMGPRLNGSSLRDHRPATSSSSTPPLVRGTHHHHRTTSSVSHAAPRPPPRARSHSTSSVGAAATTTVLVGRRRQPFVVSRRLLCSASPFFRDQLQRGSCSANNNTDDRPVTLWLPGESASMFGLFVEWLRAPRSFRSHVDDAAAAAAATGRSTAAAAAVLHWALVRLHLFAAHLGLAALQDLAMDAVQDLYLRRDWDMAPAVVTYLYTRCEARPAGRLRRWAVAMVAFSLAVAGESASSSSHQEEDHHHHPAPRLRSMLAALPELAADYAAHVRSMRAAGLDMRWKNPQLRIPANALRNDDRAFGFRECSFHSHRAAVGQGPCPHAASGWGAADTGSMLDLAQQQPEEEEEEEVVDGDDDATRQWEKEWADEFWGLEDEYTCTTSLRPPPLRRTLTAASVRPLLSKFGNHARSPSVDGVSPTST